MRSKPWHIVWAVWQKHNRLTKMEYCYSGTESLWYRSWNRHVCRKENCKADNEACPVNLALFAVPGQEHYDAVKIITDRETSSPTKGTTSPRTPVHGTPARKRKSFPIITPRKRANYQSPVKKQLFRKRQRRPEQWKRNLRKHQRNHGKAYVGRTGKHTEDREV